MGIEDKISYRSRMVATLYDRVSAYSPTPGEEIERIATRALEEGVISGTLYTVLQHRIPFQGNEREGYGKLKQRLKVSVKRVSQHERKAIRILLNQIPRHQGIELMELDIRSLPWKYRSESGTGSRLFRSLRYSYGDTVTVGQAVEFLQEFARLLSESKNRAYSISPGFKIKSYEITRKVFGKVGIELPDLKAA